MNPHYCWTPPNEQLTFDDEDWLIETLEEIENEICTRQ